MPTLHSLWRRLVRALRHAPDRFQHDTQRAAAVALLRASRPVQSILVVCHGNICRSPYAAASLRRHAAEASLELRVESAGFFGPNRGAPRHALDAAAARSTDLSAHRSRLVERELLDAADLIVVMEPGQAHAVVARYSAKRRVVLLGDLDPDAVTTREITDPYGGDRVGFDECYDRIDRCVGQLVKLLASPP